MADDRNYLTAQAQWCRRLARACSDDRTRTSLVELAVDYERRASTPGSDSSETAGAPPGRSLAGGDSRQ